MPKNGKAWWAHLYTPEAGERELEGDQRVLIMSFDRERRNSFADALSGRPAFPRLEGI